MGVETGISWTDHTWNLWWGCTKVSPACKHCYAEALATKRMGLEIWGAKSGRRFFDEKHWNDLGRWNKAAKKAGVKRKVFCSSMMDLFERVDTDVMIRMDAARAMFWPMVEEYDGLIFQFLTKRPENVMEMVPEHWRKKFPKNVWMGTTAEDQDWLQERLHHLLQIPALRFLSMEPLLAEVDLVHAIGCAMLDLDMLETKDRGVHWVIVGGESGAGARRTDERWARKVIDQCTEAETPVFFKQLGEVWAKEWGVGSRKGDEPDEWPLFLRRREFPVEEA